MRCWIAAGALWVGALACGSGDPADTADTPDPALGGNGRAAGIPSLFPAAVAPRDRYVGASVCVECHAEVAAVWRGSRHGRAMAEATPETVLGDFGGGAAVEHPAGAISTQRVHESFYMRFRDVSAESSLHKAALVLGAGRQHQVYIERLEDEAAWVLMPLYWATKAGRWVDTPRSRGFASLHEWRKADLIGLNCQKCHLSQAFYEVGERGPELSWVDLPVNCESCHGAGREHVEARRAGSEGGHFPDLRNLGKQEEAALCGQCHGSREPFEFERNGHRSSQWTTVASPLLRANGTQYVSAYQLAGHVLSDCYQQGAMRCVSCHDPHSTLARDLAGNSAEGEHSDRQCTVCHRNYIERESALAHSRHDSGVRCVDCHMSMSWIGDERTHAYQQSSDHSISIPRPRESIELGLPDACTTCHTDRPPSWALAALEGWGAQQASGTRGWVKAMHLGRTHQEEGIEQLLSLAEEEGTSDYLLASALELLASYPPSPEIARRVQDFARHEDAQVRATALEALREHDPASLHHWIGLQVTDPEAAVRLGALDAVPLLGPEERERMLRDLLAHADQPPYRLEEFVRRTAREGDLERAASILELGVRHTPTVELPIWRRLTWIQEYPPLARVLHRSLCRRGEGRSCESAE